MIRNLANIELQNSNLLLDNFVYNNQSVYFIVSNHSEIDDILLQSEEIEYINNIHTAKRKEEYINIRRIAKHFISRSLNIAPSFIKLRGGVKTQPYALVYDRIIPLSFSHKIPYYAVSFSNVNRIVTGIDIERFEFLNIDNYLDFFHDSEIRNSQELIINWSIKEALTKMIGLGMSLPAKDIIILDNNVFIRDRALDVFSKKIKAVSIKVFKYNDYVISLAVGLLNDTLN